MVVVGSKKMVIYDDVADAKLAIFDKGIDRKAVLGENMDYDRSGVAQFTHRSGDVVVPKVETVEPLRAEAEHFVDCIRGNREPFTGIAHARKVVREVRDLVVGDEKIAVVLMLQLDPVVERARIMPDVQWTGRTDPRENALIAAHLGEATNTWLPSPLSASDERMRQCPRPLDKVGERVLIQSIVKSIERVDENALQSA